MLDHYSATLNGMRVPRSPYYKSKDRGVFHTFSVRSILDRVIGTDTHIFFRSKKTTCHVVITENNYGRVVKVSGPTLLTEKELTVVVFDLFSSGEFQTLLGLRESLYKYGFSALFEQMEQSDKPLSMSELTRRLQDAKNGWYKPHLSTQEVVGFIKNSNTEKELRDLYDSVLLLSLENVKWL